MRKNKGRKDRESGKGEEKEPVEGANGPKEEKMKGKKSRSEIEVERDVMRAHERDEGIMISSVCKQIDVGLTNTR